MEDQLARSWHDGVQEGLAMARRIAEKARRDSARLGPGAALDELVSALAIAARHAEGHARQYVP